jgi:aspartate carbamoyltransferase catalytic subunit
MLSFRHLVSVDQVKKTDVVALFKVTKDMERLMKAGTCNLLKGKVIALLFYEPSTRTSLSFQSACFRLGASPILAFGKENASLKKGETIEDTIRMAMSFGDLIVMRHPEDGSAMRAAAVSSVPFINAGDGGNEHPTQGLLDLFTIQNEIGRMENLHVAFAADPLHSRTIRTLTKLLSSFEGNRFTFASPRELRMDDSLRSLLKGRGMRFEETDRLEDALDADILYINRLQEERFSDHNEFERLRKQFVLTAAMIRGRGVKIMNPLPRIDEVTTDVDPLPNALYFQQARNGVPVRMALLAMMLGRV